MSSKHILVALIVLVLTACNVSHEKRKRRHQVDLTKYRAVTSTVVHNSDGSNWFWYYYALSCSSPSSSSGSSPSSYAVYRSPTPITDFRSVQWSSQTVNPRTAIEAEAARTNAKVETEEESPEEVGEQAPEGEALDAEDIQEINDEVSAEEISSESVESNGDHEADNSSNDGDGGSSGFDGGSSSDGGGDGGGGGGE